MADVTVHPAYSFTEWESVQRFLDRVQPVLEQNESANSLILGICLRLVSSEVADTEKPFLLTVDRGEQVSLIAAMTPPFNVLLAELGQQDLEAVEAAASYLSRSDRKVPGVLGPVVAAEKFAQVYTRYSKRDFRLLVKERIHELERVNLPTAVKAGEMRLATSDDRELIQSWAMSFHREATPGDPASGVEQAVQRGIEDQSFYILEDQLKRPVSMAKKTRPTRNTISINFVYTPPEYRGNGYASKTVAELSQMLLDQGYSRCTLFTDLANPVSNSIYRKIGYQPVIDVNMYSFGDELPEV